jgi:tellurite resistance protein TehA-like permease
MVPKIIYIVTRYKWRGTPASVIRGADPSCFAMVMATGIVSVALRLAGRAVLSAVLLWVAGAAFAVLVAVSAARVVAFGPEVRGELSRPDRLFSYFAFPAAASVLAAGVLAARLAGSGPADLVAALTAVTALAWVALTGVVAAFLAGWPGPRRAITAVNGTWQLWVVGTQSTAIAATSAYAAGVLPARLAAWAAVVVWAAGAALYPLVTALVVARLGVAGLAPGDPVAPYWVTMGAASITMLGAAEAIGAATAAGLAGFRPALTDLGLVFWSVATGLIPALVLFTALRWRRGLAPRGFRRELWMIVFPAGMYATASMRIGSAAGAPAVHDTGTVAVWVAAAVWAVVFAWMISSAPRRCRRQ